ncbi:hypothetical protein HDE_00937 [Halotydeus destructor]|nr:hypothetical protein HDE_00937 [Halotydeus destructor]
MQYLPLRQSQLTLRISNELDVGNLVLILDHFRDLKQLALKLVPSALHANWFLKLAAALERRTFEIEVTLVSCHAMEQRVNEMQTLLESVCHGKLNLVGYTQPQANLSHILKSTINFKEVSLELRRAQPFDELTLYPNVTFLILRCCSCFDDRLVCSYPNLKSLAVFFEDKASCVIRRNSFWPSKLLNLTIRQSGFCENRASLTGILRQAIASIVSVDISPAMDENPVVLDLLQAAINLKTLRIDFQRPDAMSQKFLKKLLVSAGPRLMHVWFSGITLDCSVLNQVFETCVKLRSLRVPIRCECLDTGRDHIKNRLTPYMSLMDIVDFKHILYLSTNTE